jgi:hypothetical protein
VVRDVAINVSCGVIVAEKSIGLTVLYSQRIFPETPSNATIPLALSAENTTPAFPIAGGVKTKFVSVCFHKRPPRTCGPGNNPRWVCSGPFPNMLHDRLLQFAALSPPQLSLEYRRLVPHIFEFNTALEVVNILFGI